jgi:hypothetical protein
VICGGCDVVVMPMSSTKEDTFGGSDPPVTYLPTKPPSHETRAVLAIDGKRDFSFHFSAQRKYGSINLNISLFSVQVLCSFSMRVFNPRPLAFTAKTHVWIGLRVLLVWPLQHISWPTMTGIRPGQRSYRFRRWVWHRPNSV